MPIEFPESAEGRRTAIGDFLSSQPADRAFVSLGRTHFPDNSRYFGPLHIVAASLTTAGVFDEPGLPRGDRPDELDARIMMLDSIRPPQPTDPPNNGKHIMRANAVEGSSVHAPTQLYPSFRQYPWQMATHLRVVHFGLTKVCAPGTAELTIAQFTTGDIIPFDWSPGAKSFAAAVTARKRLVLRELERLPRTKSSSVVQRIGDVKARVKSALDAWHAA